MNDVYNRTSPVCDVIMMLLGLYSNVWQRLTDNNQYSGNTKVNMNLLGGLPSLKCYQNLSKCQVLRLLVIQLLSYVSPRSLRRRKR